MQKASPQQGSLALLSTWVGSFPLTGRPGPCPESPETDIIYSKSIQVFLAPSQARRGGLFRCPLPPVPHHKSGEECSVKKLGLGCFFFCLQFKNEVSARIFLCLVGWEEDGLDGRGSQLIRLFTQQLTVGAS